MGRTAWTTVWADAAEGWPARLRVGLESAAVTLAGVVALWLLGKGVAAVGQALALPNACWQLLALRAAAVALVAGVLARSGRASWWLLGAGYGLTLMLSHTSWLVLTFATLAGLAAWGVESVGHRLGSASGPDSTRGPADGVSPSPWTDWAVRWVVPLVFVGVLAGASLVRRVEREGLVMGGGAWLWDLGIRLSGAVAVLTLLAIVSSLRKGRRSS